MSAKNEQTLRRLVSSIRQADRPKTSGYDTQATVRRIESGIAWVHIPGGVDETPVKLTIAAKPGDTVQVRVSGGRAFLVGNASAPPTDDRTANAIGQNLTKRIDTTNGVLNGVRKVVESVRKIAANTNQYFWHVETGTDTGAHITEIPQEDFLADPEHGGGNLLARSNGIAVRDGLTELAQFSADGLDVYGADYNTSTREYEQVEIAHLGYADGSGSSGTAKAPYYTLGIRVGTKGNYSVAEGYQTRASGYCSHAEGNSAQATGNLSHAECRAIASGFESHAEGDESDATGIASHAEGYFTHAYGNYSHAQNYYTRANGVAQTVIGKYNAEDTTSAFIIGNGTGESNRHNALKVDWDGNLECNNIGKTLSASASKTIDTAGIDTYTEGPSVTLTAGVWVVTGQWVFNTGSTASARNLGVQLSPTSGSSASGAYKMVRVKAADNSFASLEITDIITLTASTRVYLKGASSMTYTTAAGTTIKAVRIK